MNILFDFENDPFSTDLSAQYARMALSVSMEHKVTMLYRKDAVILSKDPFLIPIYEIDYFEHERFLIEQEIDMFVLLDDVRGREIDIKKSVSILPKERLIELYGIQDLIFRN